MKIVTKVIALFITVSIMAGCKTLERIAENTVNDVVRTSTMEVIGSSSSIPTNTQVSNSVRSEQVVVVDPVRTSRDYGKLSVSKTEKNPQGQTKLVIDTCSHPRIGNVSCGGYLYEITPEQWLKEDHIKFDDLNNKIIVLAAGKYYAKFENWKGDSKHYVTGELEVKPFVTNYVSFQFE